MAGKTSHNTPITLRAQSSPWPIGTLPSAKPPGNVVIGGNVVCNMLEPSLKNRANTNTFTEDF